jgi:peptide/nickel transport system substrate-binding protein/oligopeptide transport system substrate-binding protein
MTFGSVVPADIAGLDGSAFSAAPVGTGPYWLESWKVGEKAVLQRNPSYWREGIPKADTIEARLLTSNENALRKAQTNDLDITGNTRLPSGDDTSVVNDPESSARLITTPAVATNYLSMDTSGPDSPFRDLRVRQAVNHAIDKANQIRILNGRGQVADCILPPTMPGFDPTCRPYDYSVEAAMQLMADAGMANGFSTKIYTDTLTVDVSGAQALATDLAAIGIRAEVVGFRDNRAGNRIRLFGCRTFHRIFSPVEIVEKEGRQNGDTEDANN